MIYFSSKPAALDSVDPGQYQALKEFKESCQSRGLYETFDDAQEFGEKVRRHLSLMLSRNPYFEDLRAAIPDAAQDAGRPPEPSIFTLSKEAQQLLSAAADARSSGKLMVTHSMDGSTVQAGDINFFEGDEEQGIAFDRRQLAIWEDAVRELVEQEMIRNLTDKDHTQVYQITKNGYEWAELLRASDTAHPPTGG